MYPDDLFACREKETLWWVAHTGSRREKALAHFLAQRQIGYYLPMLPRKQASKNRVRFSLMPLFPGYVFFRGNAESRTCACSSRHIVRVITIHDQHTLTAQLHNIRRALHAGLPLYSCRPFTKGQRVRIASGPMRGLEGAIVRQSHNRRLILSVDAIGQGVAVDLDAHMVEAA